MTQKLPSNSLDNNFNIDGSNDENDSYIKQIDKWHRVSNISVAIPSITIVIKYLLSFFSLIPLASFANPIIIFSVFVLLNIVSLVLAIVSLIKNIQLNGYIIRPIIGGVLSLFVIYVCSMVVYISYILYQQLREFGPDTAQLSVEF